MPNSPKEHIKIFSARSDSVDYTTEHLNRGIEIWKDGKEQSKLSKVRFIRTETTQGWEMERDAEMNRPVYWITVVVTYTLEPY